MKTKDKKKLKKAGINTSLLKLENFTCNDKNVKDFIRNFLKYYNQKYDTLAEDGKYQTGMGHHRSLGDIFRVTNYYFDTTMDEVKEALLDLKRNLVGHYCDDINRRVYEHTYNWPNYIQCDSWQTDEFGDKIKYRT